ncbi:proteasome assembly chaperone family protein [Hoyosella altamirensis]|uniref:Putative ATP-grasp superfamily ATP-dependent carboligase n=1 Tax=Hoyosella altamirensis TaxID=616997 RepID=A0A839RQT6_9ACTN|nr:PAC2 family protein [Hoyosella altamirensis]MBB3038456.1 putative ATP-grasp superfamily ATP-dependent carboligase [Hoyosella altamirensis]
MDDQARIYELEFPSPHIEVSDDTTLVLVHGLEGFADAGQAVRLATDHLRQSLETELVASFSVDDLVDYRSRRPPMTFTSDHFSSYQAPELSLYAAKDNNGVPFLLLSGMEPDFKWEKFTSAVRLLAEQFGVTRSVGLSAIPMATPHTRPLGVIGHSSNPGAVPAEQRLGTEVQVPGSASALLEYRMGQHGFDARGFSVHVPHYLAQSPYPAAAVTLLKHLSDVSGLSVPLAALEEAAADVTRQVEEQVEASPEAVAVVRALEQQYDIGARQSEETNLLALDGDLPSGDELGAQFEQFLAEQNAESDDADGTNPDDDDRLE